jgi:hypothetical protein
MFENDFYNNILLRVQKSYIQLLLYLVVKLFSRLSAQHLGAFN